MQIQRRNNTYRITVSCGYDENNKQVRRTITYKPPKGLTRNQEMKAAREYGESFERRVKGGASVRYSKMTFRTFCEGIYTKEHLSTLKPRTASGYKIIMDTRLIPYFGDMMMHNITPLDVKIWLSGLQRKDGKEGKLSGYSTANWFRTLSAIMGKAYEWSIIDENPCKRVKGPSVPRSEVKALQIKDVKKIIKKLPEYEDNRARLFILLALNTGIREAEAAGLEWRDINTKSHSISIRRTSQYLPGQGMVESTPKSKTSFRTIPISNNLISELENYRTWQNERIEKLGEAYQGKLGDEARLFTTWDGKPVYDSTLRDWLNKFLAWCDVPHVTVHGLRHTFASVLIANGTDVRTTAGLMGHSSPALVMNVYANVQDEAKERAINNLDSLYNAADDEEAE